jgi:hypothetical protein
MTTSNASGRIPAPPTRQETFDTLQRPAATRRVRTGRTDQLNVRVKPGFKQRLDDLAAAGKHTLGSLLEAMLAAYETAVGVPEHGVPIAEARAGRTRSVRLWANDAVFNAVGQIAAERKLSISGLFEDMLAREVTRLDPHGGKFGVEVKK